MFSKKQKTIKRLNPNQSHKSLGVHLAPDGNQETEIKYLKNKVNTWSMLMNGTFSNDKVRRMSYTSILKLNLVYSSPMLIASRKTCEEIVNSAKKI